MMALAPEIGLDAYFSGDERARALFERVREAVESIGEATVRATSSQVAFRRRIAFAWVWIPGRHLHGEVALLVLSVGLRRRDESSRWKEVVEPHPGRFTHHIELHAPDDIDDEVVGWLREAYGEAQ